MLKCCLFISITMGVTIDPNLSSQAHTSLETGTPVQDQTILEETGTCREKTDGFTLSRVPDIPGVHSILAR